MKYWSISFSYRLGLGFHALNNEGADGGNLMQPRRIDVGGLEYDGISGEIIRHHILENLVNICAEKNIPMLPLSEGLHPDRGPIGILAAAKAVGIQELTDKNVYESIRKAIELCSIIDIGGYLAAWKDNEDKGYVAEKAYVESNCASKGKVSPVKRDSCFDVAWLVSEAPQDTSITQHSAYRNTTAMNSRFAQTMRSNTYGGIVRADLHRVGIDNYWYLQDLPRMAITPEKQLQRQKALVRAIGRFIASPTGAKVAGWAPHVFLIEGAILLTTNGTAPFASPIKICLEDLESPIKANTSYIETIRKHKSENVTWVWEFRDSAELEESILQVENVLGEDNG